MRVLYVLPKKDYFAPGMSGRVSHAIGVADTLAGNGVDTTVLSGDGAASFFSKARVIEVSESRPRAWFGAMGRALDDWLAESDEPATVVIRYAISNSFRFLPRILKRRASVRWCYEINSFLYHQQPGMPALLRSAILKLESGIVSRADNSYVVSANLGADLSPHVGRWHQVIVVPNGGPPPVDLPAPPADAPFRFTFFGVFQIYYNLTMVIDAFIEEHTGGLDAELHFHGDGPQMQAARASAGGHPAIHFHGRYDRQILMSQELYDQRCVLLLPFGDKALNRIGSPIKMYEYMATGLPIIATDADQIRETLGGSGAALLVSATDRAAWGAAMQQLRGSKEARKAMSGAVRRCYPEHTWEKRMDYLYKRLLQKMDDRPGPGVALP